MPPPEPTQTSFVTTEPAPAEDAITSNPGGVCTGMPVQSASSQPQCGLKLSAAEIDCIEAEIDAWVQTSPNPPFVIRLGWIKSRFAELGPDWTPRLLSWIAIRVARAQPSTTVNFHINNGDKTTIVGNAVGNAIGRAAQLQARDIEASIPQAAKQSSSAELAAERAAVNGVATAKLEGSDHKETTETVEKAQAEVAKSGSAPSRPKRRKG